MRKVLATGAALFSVLAMSGCVEIKSDDAAQTDGIGDVVVTTQICRETMTPGTDCFSNTNSNSSGGETGQLLVAYRVPDAAVVPATVSASRPTSATPLELTASDSYTQELTAKVPPDPGQKWAGYIADDVISDNGADKFDLFTVTAKFSLPRPADGVPVATDFAWRTVAGFRQGAGVVLLARPVLCGATAADQITDAGDPGAADDITGYCIDSPKAPGQATNKTYAVNDIGVLGGAQTSVVQGETIAIPFDVAAVGTGLPELTVSTTTTAPGTTVTPSQDTITPSAATTALPVSLAVGPNTPPGVYDVALTLTRGGETRTNTRKVEVTKKPDPVPQQPVDNPPPNDNPLPPPIVTTTPAENVAPILTASLVKGQKLAKVLKKGLKLSASCNEACTWTLQLLKGKTVVATGKGKRAAAGKFTALAKFKSAAKKRYKKTKKLKLTAVFEATDSGGLKTAKRLPVTLKR